MKPFLRTSLARTSLALLVLLSANRATAQKAIRFTMSFPSSARLEALDGRALVLISRDSTAEPRFGVSDNVSTVQVFGADVNALKPNEPLALDAAATGYPIRSIRDLPAGDYWIQGLFHVYDTFKRGDGHTVKLPPDRGEGQQWNSAPGNLYSVPKRVHIDSRAGGTVSLSLDQVVPPIVTAPDTKYVKHVRILSDRLTKFWGRPTYIGALVVLPEGWETHPASRYPIALYHGHFQTAPSGWRESAPDPSLPPYDLAQLARECPNGHEGALCTKHGIARLTQELGYKFYKTWTGPGFPRVIMVTLQHANPYYDDSYAVNSENLGPYGDAITFDVLPELERRFRGLGPWARATYGGSTGGWEALAAQVLYPDQYNGAYASCPDPVDFHAYTTTNLYADRNAYYNEGPFRRTARPAERDYLGRTRSTIEDQNAKELALGTHSRSGGQWDIWEAVFSPVGRDGYPQRIWNKSTGVIDARVADYWREHYDLVNIMRRDWTTLGPKLQGKIHLYAGLSDNFFLNDAVYLAEDFLKVAKNPVADAVVDYGMRDEHCWSGDHDQPNVVSRLTYHERFIRKMTERWTKSAPANADVTSWRY